MEKYFAHNRNKCKYKGTVLFLENNLLKDIKQLKGKNVLYSWVRSLPINI